MNNAHDYKDNVGSLQNKIITSNGISLIYKHFKNESNKKKCDTIKQNEPNWCHADALEATLSCNSMWLNSA